MKDGIIVLNKPQNWTSSDCVAICRRGLRAKGVKKVGHGGTLDPMATGVLPIFVGQATRIMEYLDLDSKTYVCRARFGITTDTLDIWGEVLEERSWEDVLKETGITETMIREALESFTGDIQQMPPKYSAVRINGRRLYEYAYNNEEIDVEIKPRNVTISRIDVTEIDMEKGEIAFAVECSKGTYIRTICSDLGEKLGCGCTMTALERVAVGNITIDQAKVTAEQVKTMEGPELEELMLPADYPLVHFGRVSMAKDRADYFSRGNGIRWKQLTVEAEPDYDVLTGSVNARGRSYEKIYKVYQQDTGEFLGTGYRDDKENLLKADKVFVEKR